ncbi:MAG: YgiQ family radical SAM protein [Proteobacteria bacterium]|nr:YgiQ family radical SAM protein [Pseudomonadota bacterium]
MLHTHKKFWAVRLGVAEVLPMSREEMDALGWDECDIILVSGDAYIDHPAFSTGIVGRYLHNEGFRVGVVAQPKSDGDYLALGVPRLFWGINSGNMDSLVNHYTSEKRRRHDDAYTPGGKSGARPDRAVTVYAKACRRLAPEVPIVIGGIEASLRRMAHYDYWKDEVMPSILVDSGADILSFGSGEWSLETIAHGLSYGWEIERFQGLPGIAMLCDALPESLRIREDMRPDRRGEYDVRRVPSFEAVRKDKKAFAEASRLQILETRVGGHGIVQRHGDREVWIGPIPEPLTTAELDSVYDLPFSRKPHPSYTERIPAYDMIRTSVTIMRGCFGGCAFCSIAAHEGRVIQSRSPESVAREVRQICSEFSKGRASISDIGGPSANMYRMGGKDPSLCQQCVRPSCLVPKICRNLNTDHAPVIELYRKIRGMPEVKNVFIGSGVRYDLALRSPEYIQELAKFHTSGFLKIAPEHVNDHVLSLMLKPNARIFDDFCEIYLDASRKCGKKQYIIPYFISAFPGCGEREMLDVAKWLMDRHMFVDQVQSFLPTPMSAATTMYYTGYTPYLPIEGQEPIWCARSRNDRERQKAILRYHDPANTGMVKSLMRRYRM